MGSRGFVSIRLTGSYTFICKSWRVVDITLESVLRLDTKNIIIPITVNTTIPIKIFTIRPKELVLLELI